MTKKKKVVKTIAVRVTVTVREEAWAELLKWVVGVACDLRKDEGPLGRALVGVALEPVGDE